jgi:hypothetical protein
VNNVFNFTDPPIRFPLGIRVAEMLLAIEWAFMFVDYRLLVINRIARSTLAPICHNSSK